MNYQRPISMLIKRLVLPTIYEDKKDAIKEFNRRFGGYYPQNNVKTYSNFSGKTKSRMSNGMVNKKELNIHLLNLIIKLT